MQKRIKFEIITVLTLFISVMIIIALIIINRQTYNNLLIRYVTDKSVGLRLASYHTSVNAFVGPVAPSTTGSYFIKLNWFKLTFGPGSTYQIKLENADIVTIWPTFYVVSYKLLGLTNLPNHKYILDYGELWEINIFGEYALTQLINIDAQNEIVLTTSDRTKTLHSNGIIWMVIKLNPNYVAQ